jgi:hypothetical protein
MVVGSPTRHPHFLSLRSVKALDTTVSGSYLIKKI